MLLIYDETGFVEHVVLVGDFAALREVNEANGKHVAEVPDEADPSRFYVDRQGVARHRPAVTIIGKLRAIKADGEDALHLTVKPEAFTLVVRMAGVEVHREDTDAGVVEFAAGTPGIYELAFSAAFPYWPMAVTVEAQA